MIQLFLDLDLERSADHALRACLQKRKKLGPQPELQSAAAAPDSSSQQTTEPEAANQAAGDPTASAQETAEEEEEDGNGHESEAMQTEGRSDQQVLRLIMGQFFAALRELLKWVPSKEPQYAMLYANFEATQGRPGHALR